MAALTVCARTGAANPAISENPPGDVFSDELDEAMAPWGPKVDSF